MSNLGKSFKGLNKRHKLLIRNAVPTNKDEIKRSIRDPSYRPVTVAGSLRAAKTSIAGDEEADIPGIVHDVETAVTPDMPAFPEPAPIIPIPDENNARNTARKRRARQSQTGRDSTILTGLGG